MSLFIIQQLREAFPYNTAPRYLILDRDTKFSRGVVKTICSMGIEPKRIAYQSPWQNGVAERWIETVRQESLDHVIVINEAHLRRLLKEYVAYYNEDRTHLSLEKDAPIVRQISPKPCDKAQVVSLPRVGGLHHRYEWTAVHVAKHVVKVSQTLHSVLRLRARARNPIRRLETPTKTQREVLRAFGYRIDSSGVLQHLER